MAGEGGVVSAPLSADSPFPFDVNGVSMDELMSYEARGFMAEFARLPGFAENWARLKAEAAAEAAEEETGGRATRRIRRRRSRTPWRSSGRLRRRRP